MTRRKDAQVFKLHAQTHVCGQVTADTVNLHEQTRVLNTHTVERSVEERKHTRNHTGPHTEPPGACYWPASTQRLPLPAGDGVPHLGWSQDAQPADAGDQASGRHLDMTTLAGAPPCQEPRGAHVRSQPHSSRETGASPLT